MPKSKPTPNDVAIVKATEAWERVLTLVLTGVFAALFPAGVLAVFWKRSRRSIRETIHRLTALEDAADPGRSTSGLRGDGSDHPGATP